MEISSPPQTETLTYRDIDLVLSSGQPISLTLQAADMIFIPEPLASGDISIRYASGETGTINGALVQLVNQRTRTITRPVPEKPKG